MQPRTKHPFEIEVNVQHLLAELLALDQQVSRLIEHHPVAIEYELILAADQVVVGYDDGVLCGPGRQHSGTLLCFADVER